jgi:hypothetical protein
MVDFLRLEASNAKAIFGGIEFYKSVEFGNLETEGYIAKFLLSYDGFAEGITPLMLACRYVAAHNIDLCGHW